VPLAHQAIELRPKSRGLYTTGNSITDKIKARRGAPFGLIGDVAISPIREPIWVKILKGAALRGHALVRTAGVESART
jgi:hypothetical protein